MKKILSILLIVTLLMSCFVSCSTPKSTLTMGMGLSEDIEKLFVSLEQEGFSEKTEKLYNKLVESDGKFGIASAGAKVAEKINSDYLDGVLTKQEAEEKRELILELKEKVYFDDREKQFDEACLSKEKYTEGLEKLEAGQYEAAIECFDEVSWSDCNHTDAKDKTEQAKIKIKEQKISDATKKVDEKEYVDALQILEEVIDEYGEDKEIKALLEMCETEYVDVTIKQAEEAFKKISTDWEKSVKIIKQAQQYFPDNEKLEKQIEKYEKYAPVSLYDMHLFNQSSNYRLDSATDNMGKTYGNAMAHTSSGTIRDWQTGKLIASSMFAVFLLEKNYNELSFDIAVEESDSDEWCVMTVKIYGDGKLLYNAGGLSGKTRPFNKTIDVTGVDELKVSIVFDETYPYDYVNPGSRKAIFANPTLQRTVK